MLQNLRGEEIAVLTNINLNKVSIKSGMRVVNIITHTQGKEIIETIITRTIIKE